MAKGKVILIGAGPGRPDLITVRGLNALREADVIIYDYLVDPKILENAKKGSEMVCADKLGKSRHSNTFAKAQDKINRLIVKKALRDKNVVRLKNGDPSIFGRLSQEIEALVKNKIEFEIVPGVTAASAAAAYAGIPLTDRRYSSSVVFVTGHEASDKGKSAIDWSAVAKFGTIVIYMGIENLPKITRELINAGKPIGTPVSVVSNAGTIGQKSVRGKLADIAAKAKKEKIAAPAMVIIGETVKLGKVFDWLKKNKKILYTGLSDERYFLKGSYFHLPMIKIAPLGDYSIFDGNIKRIGGFDWVVFSSRFGVKYFFERLARAGLDTRDLSGVKIAAIGAITGRELLKSGVRADLIPDVESAAGLIDSLKKEGIGGKNIFMPRSDIADKGLTEGLKALGADVTAAVAYRNTAPEDLPDIDPNFFDEIMFTSPSTVRNFKKRYGYIPGKIKIRWIGEVTRKELKRQGFLHAKA